MPTVAPRMSTIGMKMTKAIRPATGGVRQFMAEHVPSGQLPCRTTVFVGLPHEVMLVEIDALAVLG